MRSDQLGGGITGRRECSLFVYGVYAAGLPLHPSEELPNAKCL